MNKIKIITLLVPIVAASCFTATSFSGELTQGQQGIMKTCDAYLNQSGTQSLSDYVSNLPSKYSQQAASNLTFCANNNLCQYSTNSDCSRKMLSWQLIQKVQATNTTPAGQNPLTSKTSGNPQATQNKENTVSSAPSTYKIPPAGIPAPTSAPTAAAPVQAQTQAAPQSQENTQTQQSQQQGNEKQEQASINW